MLDAFSPPQQTEILETLTQLAEVAAPGEDRWIVLSAQGAKNNKDGKPIQAALAKSCSKLTELFPGQRLHAKGDAWRTGDTSPTKLTSEYWVWMGQSYDMPAEVWEQCCHEELLTAAEIDTLSEAGVEYWRARQDGQYFERKDCTIAACDGSVTGDMGAAAVIRAPGHEPQVVYGKVAGAELTSSFRAEAAAMSFAIAAAPLHIPLVVYTDSMNVLHALQAWNRRIFFRDLRRQRNSDIFEKMLTDISLRTAPLRVVKVKSHRGVTMNEEADHWAGVAASAPSTEVDWHFSTLPPDNKMTFAWEEQDEEMSATADVGKVTKQWNIVAEQQMVERVRRAATMGGQFLTENGRGLHLLQKSRAVRPWTEQEERRWMQLVGRVFPVNSYLRRIDKHPTGAVPVRMCGRGRRPGEGDHHALPVLLQAIC